MPVDNEIYDRLGRSWWDEGEFIYLLRAALNPVRFGYFQRALSDQGVDPRGQRALDLGCGGGFLAEEFARVGCRVTGIDPSGPTIEAAREHATQGGLHIEYLVGVGESLPFDDASFDLVCCCDTLEHVDDLERVVAETARVLKPGGLFLYDTINRTLRSRLVWIKIAQEWRLTRFVPAGLHDWSMFIKPGELERIMAAHGIENRDLAGISPGNPVTLIAALSRVKRGAITYRQFGERLGLRKSGDTSGSYIGYGLKSGSTRSTQGSGARPHTT